MVRHIGPKDGQPDEFLLPTPKYDGKTSVEEALRKRRSVRDYADEPLKLKEVSQLLWAAQGVTGPNGERTAASAGALYPLEVYVAAGNVVEIPAGVYKYQPRQHVLTRIVSGDVRGALAAAALSQNYVKESAADIVIAAVYERITRTYGIRGEIYVHQETGHAAQNIQLQAVALELGTVVIGAFDDEKIKTILNMPEKETPMYIIPAGKIK
jgi:SagB-type dehydrogenase family enzyme